MNKKIKIFGWVLGCVIALPAFGADVSERANCSDLLAQINELTALE